ncbi:MAG: B12-binding domain-containing radical SAM protein [Lachnospiraceae bacterium]|nr:B12-binding domain-containing radical SAM protein [Lachnospiraceae bacterium]
MKFLLTAVNAKYIHSNPAVYSLRGFVEEKKRAHVEIAEYTINHRLEDILGDIYRQKPDVVAFSCYIWNWEMIQDIILELNKILPEVPIWLGGPEVSFDAPQILERFPMVTGIMVGEGEQTFCELLEYYVNQGTSQKGLLNLQDIPGLVLHSGATAEREMTRLSEIPFLYHDMAPFENRIIYYESSRGCPYRCSYCLSSIDKKLRLRDIEIVKKELQFFLEQKVPQVKFVDRTFNCDHNHAMAIWQYITDNDNGVTNFHFEISADILRADEIELLGKMRPGLVQLEIGVQTTNPQTLKEIRRNMDLEKLETNVAKIHEGGNIHQHLDLIAGLPYEDYESFKNSFNRVYRMKPQQLQLGFLKVLKGSYMHEKAEDYGLVYRSKPPYEVLYTNWLTYGDVLRLKKIEEMVELYYNSNQFTHTLPILEQAFESPFMLFEKLADFYEEKGYFVSSPARAYRYQVLLDFAVEKDASQEDLYKESLTYDMYLRENLKSRPGFAADLTARKDEIRSFYKAEEESRTYLPSYGQYDSKQLSKMTHLEVFRYPVWDSNVEADGQTYYVLFDYRERSPLTGEARTVLVELPG